MMYTTELKHKIHNLTINYKGSPSMAFILYITKCIPFCGDSGYTIWNKWLRTALAKIFQPVDSARISTDSIKLGPFESSSVTPFTFRMKKKLMQKWRRRWK